MSLPGGNPIKEASNPVIDQLRKLLLIAIAVPNPKEADETKILKAKNFEEALRVLAISMLLEIEDLNGNPVQVPFKFEKTSDLLPENALHQVLELRQMKEAFLFFHKVHEQLCSSYRTEKEFQALLDAPRKTELVEFFLKLADICDPTG